MNTTDATYDAINDRRDAFITALKNNMTDTHATTYESNKWRINVHGSTVSLSVAPDIPAAEAQRYIRDFNYYVLATAALNRQKAIMDSNGDLVVLDAWSGQVIISVLAETTD